MMITFGESWAYGVQGRKVDELLKYIKENIEYTHLKEGEPETVVTNLLEDKVAELNEKYPKTVKYFVKRVFGSIRIGNLGGATKGISIRVIISRPFEKGGEA